MTPHFRHKFFKPGCRDCEALVTAAASKSGFSQNWLNQVATNQPIASVNKVPSPSWLPAAPLSVSSVTLSPQQRETVTVVRVLSQHKDCWLYGSVSNLWLDGIPKDETLAVFYEDSAETYRDLNVGVTAAGLNGLIRLIEGITCRQMKVVKAKDLIELRVNSQLLIHFKIATNPWDTLVVYNADITANMKYVQQETLKEVIPDAIEDAKAGRLIYLGTADWCREGDIEAKMRVAHKALYRGFYGVCAEPPPPPPPPVEKYQGVLTGWRTYSWAQAGYGMSGFNAVPVPVLAGDRGHVWGSGLFEGKCDGNGDMTDPKHLERCTCGIYLQKEPRTKKENTAVYAQCVAGGLVAMHTMGYRASVVRIEKLYVLDYATPENWMKALAALYDCEVTKPVMRLGSWNTPSQDLMEFLGVERLFDDTLH